MSNQPPRNIDEQISMLRKRGMSIPDDGEAMSCFARISYSRLKYYWRDMLNAETDGVFTVGASFEEVMRRYEFDQRLKLILFDAIGTIEVALRAKVINHMSQAAGHGLWYLDGSLFENQYYHEGFVYDLKNEFNRSTEPFAKEYTKQHPDWVAKSFEGDNPDAWMIIEVATFGTLSKMYKNLKSQIPQRSAIANDFGLYSARDFTNWLEAASLMRNIVAHHSRLWNRTLGKKTVNPRGLRDKWLSAPLAESQKNRPYAFVAAILYLCNAVRPGNGLKNRILNLVDEYDGMDIKSMGFTGEWRESPIWEP